MINEERRWGGGPARLTFADDAVEDGLKLRHADLHVLRGEDASFTGGRGAAGVTGPSTTLLPPPPAA